MNADEALRILIEGNTRFVTGKTHAKDFAKERAELVSGQKPKVAMVSCSDSRVAPELIFDAGLGEIFPVRNAGNVVSDIDLGTLEYGIVHLHIPLLVVMGHQKCGAVTAAYDEHKEGNITAIMEKIKPAIQKVKKDAERTKEIEHAITENIKNVVAEIRKKSEIIAKAERDGKIKIIGMKYSLENGKIEILK